jgi:serine/threonine protein kinase
MGKELVPVRKDVSLETDYEVLEPVGFPGSFGIVSSCRSKSSKEVCAVKYIKIHKKNQEIVNSEVDIMRSLDHPNVVKTHAVYKSKQSVSFVMEMYSGGDLFDAVTEKRFVGEAANARIIRQILVGVKHLHDMHLAHCDLKLANIMLTNNSANATVKIIDFGEAQYVSEGSLLSVEVGSPSYMAPEVLDLQYNESNDMWSIGVVVFVMLCGFNPFNPKGKCGHVYFEAISHNIKKGFCSKVKNSYGAWFPKTIPLSVEAMDFISKLLVSDYRHRMTVDDALSHPWIVSATSS